MINLTTTTTAMPPRSDVFDERAGDLALEFAEDAASLVLEVGAIIHAGRDAIQRGSLGSAILYQAVSLLTEPHV